MTRTASKFHRNDKSLASVETSELGMAARQGLDLWLAARLNGRVSPRFLLGL
ncbi:MAG: hypothetical protein UIH18_00035 [Fibrobacteraceae bacterium]|nr:hypothetical protein [Fibrobacteraceae bacterium]